eukprot:jgi/Tetstr1/425335/TSEL_015784.t1
MFGEGGGPGEAARSVEDARTFRAPKLCVTEQRLPEVPAGVESLRFLEELDLSGNRLSAIPPGSVPPTLHGVTLTGNSLEELPEAVLRLPALQRLNCGANRRAAGPLPRPSALPATKPPVSRALLDPLPRLHAPLRCQSTQKLSVADNAAPVLHLTHCCAHIATSRLSSCDAMFTCGSLLHAGLSYNKISELHVPEGHPLMSLDLANNHLEDLDQTLSELEKLPRLAALSLQGNPFCLRKDYRDAVLQRLPQLRFFEGKKRIVKDTDAGAEEAAEEGGAQQDPFPMPEGGQTAGPGADGDSEPGTVEVAQDSADCVTLRLEMGGLAVKDPHPPRAPEWAVPAEPAAGAAKAKKAKAEEAMPAIPPVSYTVVWEGADGCAVSTFRKKVEIDPRKLAEMASASAGSGKPAAGGTPGSRQGSREGKKKPRTPQTPSDATPSLEGRGTVVMQLPATTRTRDWLRNGFQCKLWRHAHLLQRTLVAAATEKEAEQWAYSFEEEVSALAAGVCRAPEVIDRAGECRVKVPLVPEPALWDANDVRMGLHDERHRTSPVATITATFYLHWTPPPPPEPEAPAPTGKGKPAKK